MYWIWQMMALNAWLNVAHPSFFCIGEGFAGRPFWILRCCPKAKGETSKNLEGSIDKPFTDLKELLIF
jgi:hypothetical protein